MRAGGFTEQNVLDMARRGHEEGNAGFEVVKENCALLVIDMQDEFVKPHWTPYWVPEATRQVPHIKRLVEVCRNKNIPVIFTSYAKTHNNLDRPGSGGFMPNRYPGFNDPSWFKDGTIFQELTPLDDEIIIHKPSYGAFYDTPLETILKNLDRDTVIICGTLTNYCCGMTARQAYERGFKVVFGSDITSTDDPSMQEAELKVLRRGFARVLSVNDIIKRLE
ncbi:nicotinamidase [Desulfocucumis palustris]|uniref:Nicotinamidase n=1 Tax=Desulfocucumis palustris TaxID=1898651 RepID=A0A2L2XG63_9FIRM|nr:isochorismatase family cysteine hydrolase [Desulfocucumis palustris]GBF35130.1 nicotinamidase [Desulfocucumis palustris]